jgi:flagellar basal body-associated protein FliL
MKFIKKIQQKSRITRLLILWLATFLVMMMVIVIWLFSFSRDHHFNKAGKDIEAANLPSLFDSIGKDFSTFKQELEAGLKNIYGGQGEEQ